MSTPQATYKLTIDNSEYMAVGVSLIIANCGNTGLSGVSYIPEIDMSDGLLDVMVIHNDDLGSLLNIAGNVLMQKKPAQSMSHWKCKQVTVEVPSEHNILCDDIKLDTQHLSVSIAPQSFTLLVPTE
jgi:diacylglycerol kinase family enzyme